MDGLGTNTTSRTPGAVVPTTLNAPRSRADLVFVKVTGTGDTGTTETVESAVVVEVGEAWHVIRVEDKRKFVPPALEQAKAGIRAELLQKRRIDLLGDLARKAKIEQ